MKNIKKSKLTIYILMALAIVVNVVAIQFLPEKIPVHYNYNNEVDRWGSKNEMLVFPALTIVTGIVMLLAGRFLGKKEKNGNNNEKVMDITAILLLIIFNSMNFYYLYTAYKKVENLSSIDIGIEQIFFVMLGVFMVICGNVMPKLKMNGMIGLRTPWSTKNEEVWKKSQHFGGVSFIISGIIIIVIACITKRNVCAITSLSILMGVTIIDTIYTYVIAKEKE